MIYCSSGGREPPRSGRGGGKRTEYGVLVSNLPRGCSWQDLKDFMRKAGDVVYTDVDRNGDGVVEFSNRDDMEHAIRTLDDTEFKNYNESTFIRVKSAKKRDRSPDSRSRKRSPSHSRSRSRDRGGRRSRSPSNDSYERRKRSDSDRGDEPESKPAAEQSGK